MRFFLPNQSTQRRAYRRSFYVLLENAKLDRVYGEGLEEKLQSAAVMIHALDQKTPGLKKLLKSKGIGDSPLVVAQIIGQSERWHARRKGR